MTTYKFKPIMHRRQKSGVCPNCGIRVVRTQTFYQTDNPFNKNKDGSVRTPEQIHEALLLEADLWDPNFSHVDFCVCSETGLPHDQGCCTKHHTHSMPHMGCFLR